MTLGSRPDTVSLLCLLSLTLALPVSGLAAEAPASAAGQVGAGADEYGALEGKVTESDGTPIPGATVQLEGPLPSDNLLRTVADDNATFRFETLPPGTYRLAVELPGLRAPGDIEVEVEAGKLIRTNARLSLFAYDVSVQVVAEQTLEPQIVPTDSTSGAASVPNRALTRLPLPAEQALGVLPVLPGVVRGPGGLISIGGTLPEDSVYLFNGVDFMDAFSGQHRLSLPLDAVDNVELHTGVYPATRGQLLGGLVDVSTESGTDDWRFEVGSLIPRPRFRDGTIQGIKRASPRFRVAGPLIPGRLWISQSAEYRFDRDRVRDIPGDPPIEDTEIEGWESLTQLDWAASESHDFRLTLLGFPQNDRWIGLSGLRPPAATLDMEHDAEGALLRHQFRVDDASFLDTSVQYNRIGLSSSPRGPESYRVTPTDFGGNHFRREDRQTNHFQFRTQYTRSIGPGIPTHLVQVGGEFHTLALDAVYDDGAIEVLGAGGEPLRRVDFINGPAFEGDKLEWAFFVQDRWRPGKRFWIDAGLRLSGDDGTEQVRVAPRLGAAVDLTGNRRTLLKAGVGILHRRLFLGELLWDRLPTRVESELLEDGSRAVSVLPLRLDGELEAPRSLLSTLEVSHQFTSWLTARARFSIRQTDDRPVFDRVDPEPVILGPNEDLRAAAARLLEAGTDGVGALELASTGSQTYREWEVTANFRLGDSTQLFLTCVHSDVEGDLNDFSLVAGEQPAAIIRPNRVAPLPFDAPNRIVLWGTIDLPWDLELSPVINIRDGFPYSVLAEDQSYLGPANQERFPGVFQAAATLTKGFRLFGKSMRGGIQVRNLTGAFNPRDVVANAASPSFGEFRNSEPLRFRVRFKASF